MKTSEMAFCGIDCSGCNLRFAHCDPAAAQELVGWFRERGWIAPHEGAAEIMKKAPFCTGCRNPDEPHFCGSCRMRVCCTEKEIQHCGNCPSFPCMQYIEWTVDTPHHLEAMERLKSLKSGSGE